MAGEERTEAATPRRREEIRNRGQVARSAELTAVTMMLAGLLFIRSWGSNLVFSIEQVMRTLFRELSTQDLTSRFIWEKATELSIFVGLSLLPFLLFLVAIAVGVNVFQVGFLLSLKPLQPEFDRINPLSGLKRLFSIRSLFELAKAFAKIVLVGFVAYRVLVNRVDELLALPLLPLFTSIGSLVSIVGDVVLYGSIALFVLAAIDYGYQRWSFERSIRMTQQEVKEELKLTEGHPQLKQRIRQMQRQMAQRRMMAAVPQAQVVITNPTHLAVALRYDSGKDSAPMVVAKGERLVAERIMAIAREHSVLIIENKPLARALFASVEIGQQIPATLYKAVAEVLAFVFAVKSGRISASTAPAWSQ